MNPETKESHKQMIDRVRAAFVAQWPDIFNSDNPVPLALTIRSDILEAMPDLTEKEVKSMLVKWCHRPVYLQVHTAKAARYGLDGKPSGEVTEQQAIWATEYLENLKELAEKREKRKAEVKEAIKKEMEKKAARVAARAAKAAKAKQEKAKKPNPAKQQKSVKQSRPGQQGKTGQQKRSGQQTRIGQQTKSTRPSNTSKTTTKAKTASKPQTKAPVIIVKKKRKIVRPTEE